MKKILFIALGLTLSGIGILGAFIPILPTFPFAVAALYSFSASSPRFKEWLLNNRFLGPSIVRFKEGKGLSVRSKISILLFTWVSVGGSIVFLIDTPWVEWMLWAILLIQAWVIIRYKTYREN